MQNHPSTSGATDFARWVRSKRIAAMLTQEQLAERAGLSVRTVRNLEAGSAGEPRLQTRRLVITALAGLEPVAADTVGEEGDQLS